MRSLPLQVPRPMPAQDPSQDQLRLPGVAPAPPAHWGVRAPREVWLDHVEHAAQPHLDRMQARFALNAALSLQESSEKIMEHPLKDGRPNPKFYKRFEKMRAWAVKRHDAVGYQAIAELELNAVADALDGQIDQRMWQMAGHIDGELNPRQHQKPHGKPTHPRGSLTSYHWHKSREKGQRERFDRVRQCGTQAIKQRCKPCVTQGPTVVLSCDQHRLCLFCRKRRVLKFQRRFDPARMHLLQQAWQLGLTRPTRIVNGKPFQGGRWSEKLITLTLPHSGDVAADVQELVRAWRKFWRALQLHMKKHVLADDPHLMQWLRFTRVIEVTPGLDGQGHAHMHVWFFGPFLDQSRIAHLWGSSMSKVYQDLLMCAADEGPTTVDPKKPWGQEDVPEECACGRVHEPSPAMQTVERALGVLDCRLQRSGVSERARAAILERERAAYTSYKLADDSVDTELAKLDAWLTGLVSDAAREHIVSQQQGWYAERMISGKSADIKADLQSFVGMLEDHGVSADVCKQLRRRQSAWHSRLTRQQPLVYLWRPVVDVRECYGSDTNVSSELCKYLIKDGEKHEGTLELVHPALFARIYAALEGRRAIAATLGFLTPLQGRGTYCPDCGTLYDRRVVTLSIQRPTGPPAQLGMAL